jgi:hypothetical protein
MHRNEKERHLLTTFRRFGALRDGGYGGASGTPPPTGLGAAVAGRLPSPPTGNVRGAVSAVLFPSCGGAPRRGGGVPRVGADGNPPAVPFFAVGATEAVAPTRNPRKLRPVGADVLGGPFPRNRPRTQKFTWDDGKQKRWGVGAAAGKRAAPVVLIEMRGGAGNAHGALSAIRRTRSGDLLNILSPIQTYPLTLGLFQGLIYQRVKKCKQINVSK